MCNLCIIILMKSIDKIGIGIYNNYIIKQEVLYMNKLHFESEQKAWDFIQSIAGKLEIVDYGKDDRLVNPYYVIVGGKL